MSFWLFCGWLSVAVATAPFHRSIAPRATVGGSTLENVEALTSDGLRVCGWLVAPTNERVVLVFAGKGGDRSSNLGIADHYARLGWAVLLTDLRATGESDGERVGMGYPERLDVRTWIEFVRNRGFRQIALHGQSLGAAAITYAMEGDGAEFAFVVLDSCYDDLRRALWHRLPFVPLPALMLKPVEWFGESALGTSLDELRPIDRVAGWKCPILVIAGDADPYVRPSETRGLFDACGSSTKQLEWIEGGAHENLWTRDSAAYSAAIMRFFERIEVDAK